MDKLGVWFFKVSFGATAARGNTGPAWGPCVPRGSNLGGNAASINVYAGLSLKFSLYFTDSMIVSLGIC